MTGTQGRVVAVCAAERTGVAKRPLGAVTVRPGHGVEGDAHAGDWHRQVSLIDTLRQGEVRARVPELADGAFGENFVVDGIDLREAGIGSLLGLGERVLVEVTQIGKVCHDRCGIYRAVGECPMSSEGVFARVIEGGEVRPGDAARVERLVGRGTGQCAVVVVSDRCARGETRDTAGELLGRLLGEAGFNVMEKVLVPDERPAIAAAIAGLCDERGADAVFTAGGTGMAPRDVTPEATMEVIERPVPGIPEAIRAATMARTPRSILSRGVSGVRGRTLVVNLPGSEKGVRECIEVVLPVLGHAIETLRGAVKDCGR